MRLTLVIVLIYIFFSISLSYFTLFSVRAFVILVTSCLRERLVLWVVQGGVELVVRVPRGVPARCGGPAAPAINGAT